MKRCAKCRILKPSSEFNRSARNRDLLHSYCRGCQAQHYQDNRARHMRNVRKAKAALREASRALVAQRFAAGCVDCGILDMRVLQFDHVRGAKIAAISTLISTGRSIRALLAEMEKCEVRCANCHIIATMERLGETWHSRYQR